MAVVGFGVGIGDAVQLVIFCGCRWVTGVGVIVGGGPRVRWVRIVCAVEWLVWVALWDFGMLSVGAGVVDVVG
jgi:hypothetical protein